MLLYRVLPWLRDAAPGEPGHALYVPEPQGKGRADNRGTYNVLYLSSAPSGAVAETFGELAVWSSEMFVRPGLPRSVRALVAYDLPDEAPVFDLDDARALDALGLRPSQVVTRDRVVTQRWALAIYEQDRWVGVRWWSYYDPKWYSYALWDISTLAPQRETIRPLTIDEPAVIQAAETLHRPRRAR